MRVIGKAGRTVTLATVPEKHQKMTNTDLYNLRFNPPAWLVFLELEEESGTAEAVIDATGRRHAYTSGNGDILLPRQVNADGSVDRAPRGFGHIA